MTVDALGVIGGIIVLAGLAISMVIKNLIYICGPNEVLIFSGATSLDSEGNRRGYRIIKGGRGVRIPMIEKVNYMDLTNMIIDLEVAGAYSKGGIPLIIGAVANMKIAGEEPVIHNAIERHLGKPRHEIMRIAKETLEGNLRGVLATLTPEEVNEDKIAFSKNLLEESAEDLERLGLALDTLQVQNISDDVKYLDSIGRKQGAELIRDARVAEATASTESTCRAADNRKQTAFAQITAEIEKAKAEAQRRITDAKSKRGALVAEVQADIGAALARQEAEIAVQKARIIEVKNRLQADVVAPAEAQSKRDQEKAKANAAQVIEEGKALVEGLNKQIESWKAAGDAARDIFLMQKLEVLLQTLIDAVQPVQVADLTIIDTQSDSPAAKTASFLEQLKQASGIDVSGVVKTLAATTATSSASEPPSARSKSTEFVD